MGSEIIKGIKYTKDVKFMLNARKRQIRQKIPVAEIIVFSERVFT